MFEEIKKLLVECAHVDENEVTLDANLKKDWGSDSLYAAELTLELEEHYGIAIEWEEMLEVYTVKDVVDLIEKKVGR